MKSEEGRLAKQDEGSTGPLIVRKGHRGGTHDARIITYSDAALRLHREME